jgi:hypothetical protein
LKEPEVVLGLMKLDYLLGHKYKPRKIWWEDRVDKDRRSAYFRALAEQPSALSEQFAAYGLDERELQKYACLEELPFALGDVLPAEGAESPAASASAGDASQGTLLVVLYQQEADERPVYFYANLSAWSPEHRTLLK